MRKPTCSIGVMAYNEEANIGKLLQTLLLQQITCCELHDIVVVASGCTDRTVMIAQECARRDSRICVLVQNQREGKASAINLFIQHVHTADILVLESADTLPVDTHTLNHLLEPLVKPSSIGMTGAHPIPIDDSDHFLGAVVHLQWRLHHRIALQYPKMGELVAFRNILPGIPADTAVDEASIESLIEPKGYTIHYVPEALVYNKGPETIRDFLKQRRRITAGHHHLRQTQHYVVSTQHPLRIVKELLREMEWTPKQIVWAGGAVLLEVYGRMLGITDFYIKKKNPFTWDIATSTKTLKD